MGEDVEFLRRFESALRVLRVKGRTSDDLNGSSCVLPGGFLFACPCFLCAFELTGPNPIVPRTISQSRVLRRGI